MSIRSTFGWLCAMCGGCLDWREKVQSFFLSRCERPAAVSLSVCPSVSFTPPCCSCCALYSLLVLFCLAATVWDRGVDEEARRGRSLGDSTRAAALRCAAVSSPFASHRIASHCTANSSRRLHPVSIRCSRLPLLDPLQTARDAALLADEADSRTNACRRRDAMSQGRLLRMQPREPSHH